MFSVAESEEESHSIAKRGFSSGSGSGSEADDIFGVWGGEGWLVGEWFVG